MEWKRFLSCLFSALILSSTFCSRAQSQGSLLDLPTVVPPSPNAASLGKFGDVPVGLYTGIPSIGIPLYTVNVGSFSLPISLDYHSSGLKVEEVASWVGLGWALNAGGVITRSLHNKPDESGLGYWNEGNRSDLDLAGPSPFVYCPFWTGSYDTEPDMFYFNFCGRSGKFVMDASAAHNVHCIPYSNLKITLGGMGFVIQDENGISYVFDVQEELTYAETARYTSSWYLSKIITPGGTIILSYTGPANSDYTSIWQETQIDYLTTSGVGISGKGGLNSLAGTEGTVPVLQRIDAPGQSVIFYATQNRKDFDIGSGLDSVAVIDLNGTVKKKFTLSHSYFGNPNTLEYTNCRLKLDTVYEVSVSDKQKKAYALSYYGNPTAVPPTTSMAQDYWGFYNGKIGNTTFLVQIDPRDFPSFSTVQLGADRSADFQSALTGVLSTITYPTGGCSTFVYENNDYGYIAGVPVADTQVINTTAKAQARWDALGHQASQTTPFSIPSHGFQNVEVSMTGGWTGPVPQADGPNITLNRVNADGSRTTIIPQSLVGTSSTQYVGLTPGNYEIIAKVDANSTDGQIVTGTVYYYTYGAPIKTALGGGVRIKQILNTDSSTGKVYSKLYKYTTKADSTRSSGNLVTPLQFWQLLYGYVVRTSYSGNYLGGTQGSPVGYGMVQEVESSSSGYPLGKKESYFSTTPQNIHGDSYTLAGTFASPNYSTGGLGGNNMPKDYDVYRGLLTQEDIYNSQFNLIKDVVHNYNLDSPYFAKSSNYYSLESRRGTFFTKCYAADCPCQNITETCSPQMDIYMVLLKSTIFCPWITRTNDITTTYDQNGANPIIDTVNYYYDNPGHAQVTRQTTTNSKGDSLKTVHIYASDKSQIAGLDPTASITLDSMVNRNMIGPIIQEERYYNNTLVSRQRKDYKQLNNPRRNIALSKVWFQDGNGPLENRLNFLSYDTSNNITQVAKLNDVNISYIWDYNSLYPIAEVRNADSVSIAFTSFEAGGGGTWTIPYTTRENSAITGTKSYNLANGACTRAGLTAGANYIVSYWSKTGSPFSVTGSTGVIQGKTCGAWTYFQHTVTGVTSISVSGSGDIDELRLYPATARMTSYTYSPLVGVTSSSDMTGMITYYEYDGLSRLLRVRDMDSNILKQYDYQYQVYASALSSWQPNGQLRCKPCPANSSYTTNLQQHQETDVNPGSPTYNTTRWIDDGIPGSCVPSPDWQNTTTAVRCQQSGGANDGYQEQEQKDMNPCSSTYNTTRWTTTVLNATACPYCNSTNCSGTNHKCFGATCQTGTLRVISVTQTHVGGGNQCVTQYGYFFSDGSYYYDHTVTIQGVCQ